jgi:transcriptional regulator with XRE-family HTH domain
MNVDTLRAYLRARGITQAELARRVGVSRQAVSAWLQTEDASVRGRTLLRVAAALGVSAEALDRPLPVDEASLKPVYLWDHLYPDLVAFAIALNRREPEAIARLVQVHGLFAAERIIGKGVWARFGEYRQFIHPARRHELDTLYEWKQKPTQTAA